MTAHVLSVRGAQMLLNGQSFLALGLRCSNALISDETADDLIAHLDVFASYGVNCFSVYLMGSRFGDVRGYREDGALDPRYALRLGRLIRAADARAMVVLVGCLYWGASRAKREGWTQHEAERAVQDTVRWLAARDYRNTFLDPDNEGMAQAQAGFDNRTLVQAAKAAAPGVLVAINCKGDPPPEADLAIHFASPMPDRPYIESEGSPRNAPGGYWGSYSKRAGFYGYVNVGVYTPEMITDQCEVTREHLARSHGYLLASTWLQAAPPQGPNQRSGGLGTAEDPGVRWWLEYVQQLTAAHP
jgi:hypothetical protein